MTRQVALLATTPWAILSPLPINLTRFRHWTRGYPSTQTEVRTTPALRDTLASLFNSVRREAAWPHRDRRRGRLSSQDAKRLANHWVSRLPRGVIRKSSSTSGPIAAQSPADCTNSTTRHLPDWSNLPELFKGLATEACAARQRCFVAPGTGGGELDPDVYANDASSSVLNVTDAARESFRQPFVRPTPCWLPLRTWMSSAKGAPSPRVDLLKIDVQGQELDVLKGGQRVWRRRAWSLERSRSSITTMSSRSSLDLRLARYVGSDMTVDHLTDIV